MCILEFVQKMTKMLSKDKWLNMVIIIIIINNIFTIFNKLSNLGTNLASAIWHGFYPGIIYKI